MQSLQYKCDKRLWQKWAINLHLYLKPLSGGGRSQTKDDAEKRVNSDEIAQSHNQLLNLDRKKINQHKFTDKWLCFWEAPDVNK